MELGEKLSSLRKQNNLTQQQLAGKLFVTRTAVSKWESGKGYPSIDSLRGISEIFGVSVDSLLSGEELVSLAKTENRRNILRLHAFICGLEDILAASLIFLPIYGKEVGDSFVSVNLLELDSEGFVKPVYFGFVIAMAFLGIVEIILQHFGSDKAVHIGKICSLSLHSAAVLFCSLSHQPYITAFLFLLLLFKLVMLLRDRKPH